MSILTRTGPWRLRFLIIGKETNVESFLTSNDIEEVVTVESEIQPNKQEWFALPVEGRKDFYVIVKNPLASKSGSGFRLGLEPAKDSNKVVLSPVPAEWLLEYVPPNIVNGKENVYKIVRPDATIEPEQSLLPEFITKVSDGLEAVLQPETEHPKIPIAAWQFIAV